MFKITINPIIINHNIKNKKKVTSPSYPITVMHKYEIIDMIDEGAYGIVWKATNK